MWRQEIEFHCIPHRHPRRRGTFSKKPTIFDASDGASAIRCTVKHTGQHTDYRPLQSETSEDLDILAELARYSALRCEHKRQSYKHLRSAWPVEFPLNEAGSIVCRAPPDQTQVSGILVTTAERAGREQQYRREFLRARQARALRHLPPVEQEALAPLLRRVLVPVGASQGERRAAHGVCDRGRGRQAADVPETSSE